MLRTQYESIQSTKRNASHELHLSASIRISCCIIVDSLLRLSESRKDPRPVQLARPTKALYFFPLFLMPCPPVFRGPLPLALSASSFLALASVPSSQSNALIGILRARTSSLFGLERQLLLVKFFLLLLWRL